ncbi:MAG: GDP-mannose 4,6-dehydratase, partial [Bdellovibrionales bacterium]|nr:GDP-mannose 4,6-dehydratase [Bdellovibrionales bacterium]
IFHLAAQAGVRASWGKDFSIYTGNNIYATQRVLEAAKGEGVRNSLKKVVYASSSSVYGHAETLPTVETLLPKPISPYGVSKLAAEHLMVLYSKEFGVPTASVRYFTVYGPRQRPDMAFHRFIRAGLKGETLRVFGDGEQSRDFTFISDAVAATIAAASAEEEALVCNIGGGSRVTVNEVLSMIGDILGEKLKVEHQEREKGDARHTGADTTKAREALGYNPKVGLRDGLTAEASWLREMIA